VITALSLALLAYALWHCAAAGLELFRG